ncbi:HD-GYP domain-containing protein [Desulfofarcimen acetoxidans]|uniref:HD-GYP domain-containing protein n=1 Tax=Desulfofarcimen acetoxidans TaxID=58138 RepID=UPI001F60C112|nr:HD-GYP domain-containing protein [Desulfofarcimen acetoxidans]
MPIYALQPGQKVGKPVINGSGQVLLNRGVILTRNYIDKLYRLGIVSLYIDDGLLPDIEVNDIISDKTRIDTIKHVKDIMTTHNEGQSKRCGASILASKKTLSLVYDIIDQLLDNNNLIVNLIDIRTMDDYTYAHSVNVCVLSVLTGISMGMVRSQLVQLAIGALFHDIGKMLVPLSILNKPAKLTPQEFEEIKLHPGNGFNILSNDTNISRNSALIAQQHHERYNGEGYPGGLEGEAIHLFSQIVGMVDMYDALTADRIYRKGVPPQEVYEMILGSGDCLFKQEIINQFLKNIAAYPAGTVVKLSTGEIAIVIETLPGYTQYPKVRILFTDNLEPVDEQIEISLLEHRNITILPSFRKFADKY